MGVTVNGEGGGWALEVVRGNNAGRVFALAPGEVVLGNAPGGSPGIDLSDQESSASLRRMAARHAALDCSPRGLSVRDLESPGGTFVNRQRVLPGQAKPLQAGDVVQVGGVQLRVISGKGVASPTPEPRPSPEPRSGPFSYAVPGGPTCRSWDDFLTASAQRWETIRDELTSGRLAAFLISIGRRDLAPSPDAPGNPDERLDAWLGSLPTVRPALPELDVHPSRVVIRATPGGGTIRRSVRVANVGHRLLRSTARFEPAGTTWLAIAAGFPRGPFATVEETELPIEVAVPESLPVPLHAELVIESNGGSKRVAIVLEMKSARVDFPEAETHRPPPNDRALAALIARQSPVARVATWGMAALAVRLVVGVAGGAIGEDAMTASGRDAPGLGGAALVLAATGALVGAWLAARRGGRGEIPTGAFAGGFAGVITASALIAACRSIEPVLGSWSSSVIAVCVLWALLGGGLAGLSTLFVKGKP